MTKSREEIKKEYIEYLDRKKKNKEIIQEKIVSLEKEMNFFKHDLTYSKANGILHWVSNCGVGKFHWGCLRSNNPSNNLLTEAAYITQKEFLPFLYEFQEEIYAYCEELSKRES